MTDPAHVLNHLGARLTLDLARTTRRLLEGEALAVGHVLTANRARWMTPFHFAPRRQRALGSGARLAGRIGGWIDRHFDRQGRMENTASIPSSSRSTR
jgi:hypothetical protein